MWPRRGGGHRCATATAIIGYLQPERALRPVAVAVQQRCAENALLRLMLAWIPSTGVPLPGDRAGRSSGQDCSRRTPHQRRCSTHPDDGTGRVLGIDPSAPCWWPGRSPTCYAIALGAAQRGNYRRFTTPANRLLTSRFQRWSASCPSGSGCDLFGRYVGEDVARRALSAAPKWSGTRRRGAVRGSGRLHATGRDTTARRCGPLPTSSSG